MTKEWKCPFCGNTEITTEEDLRSVAGYKIICSKCHREYKFCQLCDSPDLCLSRPECIRGFQEIVHNILPKKEKTQGIEDGL